MSLVISEKFDGVTAPAIPSDIVASILNGTITTSTDHALSGTNSLKFVPDGGGTIIASAFSTIHDNSSGNCTVSCSIYLSTTVPSSAKVAGVEIGVNSQVYYSGSGSSYNFAIYNGTSGFALDKLTSGSGSTLATNAGAQVFSTGIWYTLTLTRNGANLWCSCQRLDTLQWAAPAGGWQASYVEVIAVTDGSPLSSSISYGGVYGYIGSTAITFYADNLVVRDQVTNLPAGVIKGMNCPSQLNAASIAANWQTFPWAVAGGYKTQIDLAKSLGCNCIRCVGGYYGSYEGFYTASTYLSRLAQVISYCKSQGLYFYLTEYGGQSNSTGVQELAAPFHGSDTQATVIADLVTQVTSIVNAVAGFPNILAYDIVQEYDASWGATATLYNGGTTASGTVSVSQLAVIQALTTTARNLLPSFPVTFSFNGLSTATGATGWNKTPFASYSYLMDFIDTHVYYAPGATDANSGSTGLYTNAGTSGKKLFIGEFGDNQADTQGNQTARLNAVWSNVVQATYTSQPGCFGGEWWACVQYDATAANDWGMFTDADPAVARSWLTTPFSVFSSATYSFGSNFRRRRR